MPSDNLNLPQIAAATADKPGFINELFALIDSSVTASIAQDASTNAALSAAMVQNYLKIVATATPKAGTTLTLPVLTRMLILKNDKASLGPVTFACGTASIVIAPGLSCIAYMDGTANGLEIIQATPTPTYAALADVDMSTPPQDGQVPVWSATKGKWVPGTISGSGTPTPTPNAFKQLRVRAEAIGNANEVGIGQIIFKDSSGNVIPTTGGNAFASSMYDNSGSYKPDVCFDGNPPSSQHDGWYATPGKKAGEYIGYIFTAAVTVASITMLPPEEGTGYMPTQFAVEGSNDGNTWTVIKDAIAAAAWQQGVGQTFAVS